MPPADYNAEARARERFFLDALSGWRQDRFRIWLEWPATDGVEKPPQWGEVEGSVRDGWGIYKRDGKYVLTHMPSGLQTGPPQDDPSKAMVLCQRLIYTPIPWSMIKGRDDFTDLMKELGKAALADHEANRVPDAYLTATWV